MKIKPYDKLHTPQFVKEAIEERIETEIEVLKRLDAVFSRCYWDKDCHCCPYHDEKDCMILVSESIDTLIKNQIEECKQYLAEMRN